MENKEETISTQKNKDDEKLKDIENIKFSKEVKVVEKIENEHTLCECQCRTKQNQRDANLQKSLQNRLNRIVGQLNGISKMLDENRYCADVLIQVSASINALKSLAYTVLDDHMKTCVKQSILSGSEEKIDEVLDLVKKLK